MLLRAVTKGNKIVCQIFPLRRIASIWTLEKKNTNLNGLVCDEVVMDGYYVESDWQHYYLWGSPVDRSGIEARAIVQTDSRLTGPALIYVSVNHSTLIWSHRVLAKMVFNYGRPQNVRTKLVSYLLFLF